MWCMVIALIGPTSFQWNREKFNEHLPLSSRQYVPLVASERCGKWWVSIWESISLAILEFLEKKERERVRKKYRVDQHSRDDLVFFDFAINYRICERSARIPMWNRVKLRIAHHLTAFFLFLFFSSSLLPETYCVGCSRDFLSTVILFEYQSESKSLDGGDDAAWSFLLLLLLLLAFLSRCANCKQCPPRKIVRSRRYKMKELMILKEKQERRRYMNLNEFIKLLY